MAYGGERTLCGAPLVAEAGALAVTDVRLQPGAGRMTIEARITNHAQEVSRPFAPLLAVTDEHGADVGETAMSERVLGASESVRITLQPAAPAMKPGVYYVSVIPAHPGSGRALGAGQYYVGVRLD